MSGSVLLSPYRSLGLVASASAAAHLKLLGGARFLSVPLGRAWCVYNVDQLRVALMGAARAHPVRAIASVRDLTFTACGNEIIVWRRQDEQCRLRGPHSRNVYILYQFGTMLCSVDEGQTMAIWDVQSLAPAVSVKAQLARATAANAVAAGGGSADAPSTFVHHDGTRYAADWKPEPISVLQFPFSSRISSVLHPSTYLNKIVVGFGGNGAASGSAGAVGGLELWNIKTRQCVFRFKPQDWNSAAHNPEKKLAAALGRDTSAAATAHGTKRGADGTAVDAAPSVSVTCLEQSPAVDVVAVGLSNGLIVLLNLRLDQVLHVYVHAAPSSGAGTAGGTGALATGVAASPVSSLSFRTDNHGGQQLASACAGSGTIAVWDLEKKQLKTLIKGAHGGGGDAINGAGDIPGVSSVTIHSMFFLPNEPVLVTVGSDNAIRSFLFDALDGSARLLRERSGHALPPSRIRFYPSERGQLDILSCGADRALRSFSLQKEEQGRELSQGHIASQARAHGVSEASLKLTPIVDFAASGARDRDGWPNIVSAHQGDAAAYTWSWKSKSRSKHSLLNTNPMATASAVKSVAMSACGNYAFLGMHNGRIDQFNVQSGTWKATFGTNHQPASATAGSNPNRPSKNINVVRKQEKAALAAAASALSAGAAGAAERAVAAGMGHTAAVSGLAVDALNRQVISCSLDGTVLFWDFKKRSTVLGRVDLGAPASRMAYSAESELLAVMDDKLVLHVLDAVSRTVVRRFHQHTAPLTDLIFSPDSRWLLTASSDCSVRIFDLASATLIDYLRFSKPVSSITMSPKGDFVATTHVNNLGVYLWANKAFFGAGGAGDEDLLTATSSAAGGPKTPAQSLARRVANNRPVDMEVVERQDGAEEDEELDAAALHHNNVKQEDAEEEDENDEEEEEEDSEDEDAGARGEGAISVGVGSKRRRGLLGTPALPVPSSAPLLHALPESDQLDLITYSSAPKSQWQTLAHLDAIRARNAPKEAVKAPSAAPFFLTALASLSNETDGPSAGAAAATAASASQAEQRKLADAFGVSAGALGASAPSAPALGKRTVKSGGVGLASKLVSLLETAKRSLPSLVAATPHQHPRSYLLAAYAPVSAWLQTLSAPSLDAELVSLGMDPSVEESELKLLLEFFLAALESQQQFEFVQALLQRFLRLHGSTLTQYPTLLALSAQISEVQRRVWARLEESLQANLALVSHLAQIQL